MVAQAIGPGEELVGDAFRAAVAVGLAFGEQVPDNDEQLMGNDHDSVVGVLAAG